MLSLPEWLELPDQLLADTVGAKISTVVVYLNGTRRWFLSQYENWNNYAEVTGNAQRELSQQFYDLGIQTLIQPLLGYDLLSRGERYIQMAVEQGLMELGQEKYRNWYHSSGIRVTFYGNWRASLSELGFTRALTLLDDLTAETRHYSQHQLLFGLFADEGLDNIVTLAKKVNDGNELLRQYYGQAVNPVDIIIGSGQPAIWDLPLLDINKASLYFYQAPTLNMDGETLRHILYDHLYQRLNDDDLYENLAGEIWEQAKILGIGLQSEKGWKSI